MPAAVSQDRTHSHFDAMDVLEGGLNTPSSDGWAARALRNLPNPAVLSAVMVGGQLPKSLAGSQALTLDRLESFGLAGGDEVRAKSEATLAKFFGQYKDPVAKSALETLNGIKTIRNLGEREYQPAAQYPNERLRQRLPDGRAADQGPGRAAVRDHRHGRLRHPHQLPRPAARPRDRGGRRHERVLPGPRRGAAAVRLRGHHDGVRAQLAARTASQGTDHGHGMGMQVLGGGSTGGVRRPARTSRPPPGQRDHAAPMDYRDVLTEGLTWLGVRNAASVFPGHRFRAVAGAFKK